MTNRTQLLKPKRVRAELTPPYINMTTPAPTLEIEVSTGVMLPFLHLDFHCSRGKWGEALKHVTLYRKMNYEQEIELLAKTLFAHCKPQSMDTDATTESQKDRTIRRIFGSSQRWKYCGDFYTFHF